MLRLIQCEFLKLKRKRLFQAAFLTTFIMPVLYSLLLSDSSFDDLMSVIREENGFLLLIPLTVVLAANLFFEEHDYDTLKNLMCVPVTKGRLTMAKLFVWAASMPCILIVVWCNKSYIISVIIAFAYVTLNYILRINDSFLMVPAGLNLPTFLPVPMIFRWLYQFHSIENVGEVLAEFYERFQPYFISGPLVFTVLLSEAAVCIALIIQVYKKQDV